MTLVSARVSSGVIGGDLGALVRRWWRPVRSFWCVVARGGHELYRAHSATRLYQQCALCGHCTRGWDVTPRRG
jgi:hypothetical protein